MVFDYLCVILSLCHYYYLLLSNSGSIIPIYVFFIRLNSTIDICWLDIITDILHFLITFLWLLFDDLNIAVILFNTCSTHHNCSILLLIGAFISVCCCNTIISRSRIICISGNISSIEINHPSLVSVIEDTCLFFWIAFKLMKLLILIRSAVEVNQVNIRNVSEESECEHLILLVLVFLFDARFRVHVVEEGSQQVWH